MFKNKYMEVVDLVISFESILYLTFESLTLQIVIGL